jgi:hypothetical protein
VSVTEPVSRVGPVVGDGEAVADPMITGVAEADALPAMPWADPVAAGAIVTAGAALPVPAVPDPAGAGAEFCAAGDPPPTVCVPQAVTEAASTMMAPNRDNFMSVRREREPDGCARARHIGGCGPAPYSCQGCGPLP